MRFYFVTSLYMRSIHAGIQAAHCLHEIYEKYHETEIWPDDYSEKLHDWANNHKTIIILRGHGNDFLEDKYVALAARARDLHLPFGLFREPEMRNSVTAIGILLPSEYYDRPVDQQSWALQKIHEELDNLPLAI